ncbi:MAG: cytochrome c3 family protein [Acidobacteriota bacterium]|nr:cytochrome c3 family protein [Acidobacteriota bacterium]MDH3530468.1 cytochrome c3 family protein [Acidobacteriota bacterium]
MKWLKSEIKQRQHLLPAFFYGLRKYVLVILVCLFMAGMLTTFSTDTVRVAAQKKNSCAECHSKLEGRLGQPSKLFENDIHNSRGLSCNDCHGGDPTKDDKAAAKSPYSGYLGTPGPTEIASFCGKCHSDASVMKKFNPSLRVDQVQEYYTSVHGTRLRAGDKKVATCISCHGNHGIRKSSDTQSTVYPKNVAETCAKCHSDGDYMKEYGIPHDQYEKYKASVHFNALNEKNDLSAPTCNDCHGNHGAVPPGITSVANVCGQCHSRQADLFRKSVHKDVFDRMQIGECLRCHNNHAILTPTDDMLGIEKGSVCITCHSAGKGFQAAKEMRSSLAAIKRRVSEAEELLEQAERAGMEVSHPKFELEDAIDSLTQARVSVHSVSVEELNKATAPGLAIANKSFEAGLAAFGELNFRRKGLAVSLVFIFFLAALIFLKIKQIERPAKEAGNDGSPDS